MISKNSMSLGAVVCALAVLAGAFGAHGLKNYVIESDISLFKTAAQYQMIHGLALVILGVWVNLKKEAAKPLSRVAWLFLIGIILFSGSLYLLVLTQSRSLGMITPLGGISFIVAWLSWAWAVKGEGV